MHKFLISLSFFFISLSHAFLDAVFPAIEDLTIEEKVGQLLIVHFNGNSPNEEARRLITEAHVGGFIYYNWANGLDSPTQVGRLSSGLQAIALAQPKPIPLFISVDQEGGLVRRLTQGFTSFPGNAALRRTGQPEFAEKSALAMGLELGVVGVNVNFAPLVDVNSNIDNPVIGIRSFGDNAKDVINYGKAALEGYRKASIIACLKHYPGHGDAAIDSHGGLPIIDKKIDVLANVELRPFHCLASKVDMIMTAHIMVPAFDRWKCSTTSYITLESILRRGLHYQGLIISDSLVMQGVLDNNAGKMENVVVNAFLAGCDILLLGGRRLLTAQNGFELSTNDVIALHRHLVDAVKNKRISEERLNASVIRILKLKEFHPAFHQPYFDEATVLQTAGSADHHALAELICKLSVKIDHAKIPLPYDVSGKNVVLIASDMVAADMKASSLWETSTAQFLFNGLEPSHQENEKALALAKNADAVVICTYNAWKNPEQMRLAKNLEDTAKLLFVIALRDARDADCFDQAAVVATTVSPIASSITAAWEKITKISL